MLAIEKYQHSHAAFPLMNRTKDKMVRLAAGSQLFGGFQQLLLKENIFFILIVQTVHPSIVCKE